MSALAREPLTMKDVRKMVYGRLPLWGEIQQHGPLAPPRDGNVISGAFTSRLPVPAWALDLSLAFSRLNPDTILRGYRFSLASRSRMNDHQRVIYAYYVTCPDIGDLDTRSADKTLFAHQREAELQHAIKAHDSKRDAAVAKLLHIDSRRVRYLRQSAVWTMSTLVGWERDE